jgi:hypothetical protein
MSTWEARYVRLADRTKDLERAKAYVTRAHAGAAVVPQVVSDGAASESGAAWVGWLVRPVGAPELSADLSRDLSDVSRDFGEAIGIAVQTVADLIVYDRFVKGTRVRGLTYAGEAGWVRVFGEPEPWESRAIFSQTQLETLRSALEEELTGDALARDTEELERLWKLGKLEEGSPRPPVAPLALARQLEKHFSLPSLPRK